MDWKILRESNGQDVMGKTRDAFWSLLGACLGRQGRVYARGIEIQAAFCFGSSRNRR
jgi:hypothetical protein